MTKSRAGYSRVFLHFFISALMSLSAPAVLGMCANVFSDLSIGLDIPVKIVNILKTEGIHTVEKLRSKEPEDLLELPNFSREHLESVEYHLDRSGLSLSGKTPLSSLELSIRSANVVRNAKIYTVEDLISKTPEELLRLPDFSEKSLQEVETALAKRGLSLKGRGSDGLEFLGLSGRVRNTLSRNAKIYTVEDLISKTPEELLRLPDFSKRSLREVEHALAVEGLFLTDSTIFSLHLSDKSEKTLHSLGIRTRKDFMSKTPEELMNLPELVKKDLRQSPVNNYLDSDVSLLDLSQRDEKALREKEIHTVKELLSKTKQELIQLFGNENRALAETIKTALAERNLSLIDLDESIFFLAVPSRFRIALVFLMEAKIKTIAELMSKTENQLIRLFGVERSILVEITKTALAERGLSLRELDLNNSINSLDFSIETQEALQAKGIGTIAELVSKTESELIRVFDFKYGPFLEVKKALDIEALSLSEEPGGLNNSINSLGLSAWIQGILRAGGVYTIKELMSKIKKESLLAPYLGRAHLEDIKTALANYLGSIDSLGLSSRVLNILRAGELHSIKELSSKTQTELLRMPNMENKDFLEIKAVLIARKELGESALPVSETPTSYDESIDSLGLSERSQEALHEDGILTVKDLVNIIPRELLRNIALEKGD